MARYSIYVRPDLLQLFWAGMQAGDFITDAVVPINTSRRTGRRVLAEAGGPDRVYDDRHLQVETPERLVQHHESRPERTLWTGPLLAQLDAPQLEPA